VPFDLKRVQKECRKKERKKEEEKEEETHWLQPKTKSRIRIMCLVGHFFIFKVKTESCSGTILQ